MSKPLYVQLYWLQLLFDEFQFCQRLSVIGQLYKIDTRCQFSNIDVLLCAVQYATT